MNTQSLDTNRTIGDPDADRLVSELFREGKQSLLYSKLNQTNAGSLMPMPDNESPVDVFLQTTKKEPVWLERKRLEGGQEVFSEYAQEIMMLLGVMALPYCYAGSPGNKALYLSEKMRNSPGKRLLDTGHFVISVSTPGAFAPGGTGHVVINKTRLIHAIARYHLKKGNWNMEWGEPINQEDMAGTNLAFSLVTLLGMQQSGLILSDQQKEDFIHLWRYIGYQLSITDELLPATYAEAYRLTQTIRRRNFRKSHEGQVLTRELIKYYKSLVPRGQASFIEAQMRYYLGEEVSEYLGLRADVFKDQFTFILNDFKALQNMLTLHTSTFHSMLSNHRRLNSLSQ